MIRRLWYALLVALQFLTRIPVGDVPQSAFAKNSMRVSLAMFPYVGGIVGLAGATAFDLARALSFPSPICAVLTVGTTALLTGALHEDGLADTFDALGTYRQEDALRVMRDSRIGTFGSIALWTTLSLKAIALATMPESLVLPALVTAHALSRLSSLPLALCLPYLRDDKGAGSNIASIVDRYTASVSCTASFLTLFGLFPYTPEILSIMAASLTTIVSGWFFKKRFSGITGDCLGAANQVVEVVVLVLWCRARTY